MLNDLLGVAAIEEFFNCPVHSGGTYSGMIRLANIGQLQHEVITGLNSRHIDDILSFNGHEYVVKYDADKHSFIGASIYEDGVKICATADNGSGKLYWVNS